MTTLIYSEGKIYSDSHIASKKLTKRDIEELDQKSNFALMEGNTFKSILMTCQRRNPYLGEEGTSSFAEKHGKFYWFKYEHYIGDFPLIAVGIAGNMMGYSVAQALDTYSEYEEFDLVAELGQIQSTWVEEAGEQAGFEYFFVVPNGIVVVDREGTPFFLSKADKKAYVFGSGRTVLKGHTTEQELQNYYSASLEDFYGTDYPVKTIMEFAQERDPNTNDKWVSFDID